MNRRTASAILRLRHTLSTLIDCASGGRPAWWDEKLESLLQGELCAVYEQGLGERDGALIFTDDAIGVVNSDGLPRWVSYATIVDWTPPRKESPSTTLNLVTTSGECELHLRDGDPLRLVSFVLWLSRADRVR